MVASADVAKGGNLAKRCAACHSFDKGGPNKVGPALWGVVNRPVASVPEYAYSEAMVTFATGGIKLWTIDELNPYLENPKGHVPGTKMVYPGLKKEDERASLIAYLRSLSDSPVPLP
jgi:cytochrome c